jgi:hypothetical protein
MREIRTSGVTRGEGVGPQPAPPLLYCLRGELSSSLEPCSYHPPRPTRTAVRRLSPAYRADNVRYHKKRPSSERIYTLVQYPDSDRIESLAPAEV